MPDAAPVITTTLFLKSLIPGITILLNESLLQCLYVIARHTLCALAILTILYNHEIASLIIFAPKKLPRPWWAGLRGGGDLYFHPLPSRERENKGLSLITSPKYWY
jgi:hypothetical protein